MPGSIIRLASRSIPPSRTRWCPVVGRRKEVKAQKKMSQSNMPTPAEDTHPFLSGGGEMGRLIRSIDWSGTPLGPVESWPQSLRTTINICLASDLPICVIWGPGLVQIYNDGYRVICGGKHPRSMGLNFPECWKEAWPVIGDAHDSALTGDTAFLESQHIFLERHGYLEECFFTFSFSPIRDEAGRVGGLFHPVIEMTAKMLGERRTRALRDLVVRTSKAKSVSEALALSALALAEYDLDLPFVLIYALDPDAQLARLVGRTGLVANTAASPDTVDVGASGQSIWPVEEAVRSGSAVQVNDVGRLLGTTPCGSYPEPPSAALVLPIFSPGADRPAAVLVAGVSPRLPLDEAYRSFYDLLASGITTAVINARAREEEQRRAEALAELDRAKIAFFSNVSHEFRTPLTLMLGPVEELLDRSRTELSPAVTGQLEFVNRNGLRLLRLVNTLLDFTRIEAGRVRAVYQPTDLAAYTAELASVFRAAIERAGLRLAVDCPPLGEAAFVDRGMWEKIVMNLLSNAFKFTFEGEIAVTLRRAGNAAELVVRDTGTGIPAAEMPRLFERFHRVENARGRTHEGSGIGLALVQEVVKLHGGSITAESIVGTGTTFTASVPLGSAHLPTDQIGDGSSLASTGTGDITAVEEALRWLPDDMRSGRDSRPEPPTCHDVLPVPHLGIEGRDERPRVVVADDNADMRQYVVRLLAEHFRTQAVPDGEAALAVARDQPPDLILTDVMMPRLDGFGLLRELRADPRTSDVPVIMLSARAGEESRVEGIEARADDYLVKPFSARELLARVTAQLQMARLRREASESIRASEERFRALVSATSDVVYRMSADWTEMRHLRGREFIAETHEPSRSWLVKYIPPDAQSHVMDVIHAAIRSKSVFELEHPVIRIDGTLGWTFSRAIPLLDGNGEIVEWFGAASDVSARKQAEQERERLVGQLREQDQRKDEFLATLAHELRNPLAPLRNGLQVMKLAMNNAEAVERSRTMMERQLAQMIRLIDDLLDVSRISQGKIELKPERVDLAKIVRQAVENSRPLIEQGGHELVVDVSPDPIYVDADVTRLAQVYANLLNNAAKYTEPGGCIRLTVERQGDDAVVTVGDNGVGIAAHMLPKVFELFTQVDRSLEKSQGRLGIGLSLVKGLVGMHGGSVEARSNGLGTGSEFVVRVPVVLSVVGELRDEGGGASTEPGNRRRILVVDDNRDGAESLAMMLTFMGNELRTAHDGLEALDVAAAFRPDLILLDIGMPRMNGYDTARRIREQPWGKNTVLVALTGWGQEEDRQKSHDAGFDTHMVKPVDLAALEKLLANLKAETA